MIRRDDKNGQVPNEILAIGCIRAAWIYAAKRKSTAVSADACIRDGHKYFGYWERNHEIPSSEGRVWSGFWNNIAKIPNGSDGNCDM